MLKIYTNESVNVAITEGLKRRGVRAWSARDTGNLGMTDKEQFRYAYEKKAVIITMDDDFLPLAHKWSQERKEHYGIVYVHPEKLSVGECIRRIKLIVDTLSVEDMRNHIEFL